MKKLSILLIFAMVLSLIPLASVEASAADNSGYSLSSIDNYVGTRIVNWDYTYDKNSSTLSYAPYKVRYTSKSSPQCVGYAYARAEAKLDLSSVGFNSGNGAKDIPGNAKKVNGSTVKSYVTNKEYKIAYYDGDNGANIKANSFVCFNGWGSSGSLTSYGHVVFVEEVVKTGGTTYVYYTEGSSWYHSNGTDGILKKLSLSDFVGGKASSGKYMATICFECLTPSCDHSWNSYGFCTKCFEYDSQKDTKSLSTTKWYTKAKSYQLNCACQVRPGPYKECMAPEGKSAKGTKYIVIGELTNGRGNLWYITNDGRYLYSEYVDYVGYDDSVSFSDVTVSGVTQDNAVLKTTVTKKKGADAQKYGVTMIKLFSFKASKVSLVDTYVKDATTGYNLSMDLKTEAKFTLEAGSTYLACLTVTVDNAPYTSDCVLITTAGSSGTAGSYTANPVLDADTVKAIEAAEDSSATSSGTQSGSTSSGSTESIVTPVVSNEAITWNTGTVTNVTANTAFVKYTLTPVKSKISRIGLEYCTDGSSYTKVPGCEWAGSTLTNFCSVAFDGSEGPTLSPGTQYFCRFYIIKTDGTTEYSPVLSFTTGGTAVRQYTVTFNVNRDDSTEASQSSKIVSTDGTFGTLPTVSSSFASFLGWYTQPTGGTQVTESTAANINDNITLYAHWQPLSVTVYFNANGGSVTQSSKTVTNDSTFGQLPVPTRGGYTFAGWYYSDSDNQRVESSRIVSASGNFTLYARWIKNEEETAAASREIKLTIGSPYITVDGTSSLIDSSKTVPVIRSNRTLLPIASIINAMGGTVEWTGSLRMVTLTVGEKTLYLKIDSKYATDQDYKTYIMDVAPVIINNRTMLPVSFIVQFFGAEVGWDGTTKTVTITY